MIKVKNLKLKFTKEYYALNDIDLNIKSGEKVAFVGEKDSGKTTLLRVLCKLEKFDSGEVYIKNIPLAKIDFKNDIEMGYIPASPVFMDGKSVRKNLEFVIKNKNLTKYEIETKIDEALAKSGLSKLIDEKVKNLSLYEKYLLSFVRLSFRNLDVVLIDNIFDEIKIDEIKKLFEYINIYLSNEDTTVIIATTNEDFANELKLNIIKFNLGSVEK